MKADLALWPIQFSAADNDLGQAQARITESTRRTLAFLAGEGLDTSPAKLQAPQAEYDETLVGRRRQ